ncbi:MAG: hypothetical protein CMB80_11680 [Flammeovirgaceae bacterium]|nr:hypothetical protein [Flammeovirgaceae bacterium]MBR10858.1 hypothetical protein [Rickettsiales bacterium]
MLWSLFSACSNSERPEVDYSFEVAKDVVHDVEDFEQFEFTDGNDLDLGFYEGVAWIKLEILNTGKPTSLVVLCGDLINQNYRFYELDELNHQLKPVEEGIDTDFNDHRTHHFAKPNFQIDLGAGEKGTYYISTSSDGRILQGTPQLVSLNDFHAIKQGTLIFDIVFYGVIAILILINLFYFQSIRSNIYYFYGAYILCSCLMYLFVEGRLYGRGLSHATIDHLMFVSIRLWILTSILFAMRFLKTKETNRRFYKFIIILLILTLGTTTIYQFSFPGFSISTLHMTENLLGFLWIVTSLLIVSYSYKKRKLESTYYLIAFSFFIFFVTLGLLDSHMTMLPGDPFSYFKIGTIFEFIGFTYFITVLIKKKLNTSNELELELNQTRQVLGERENELKDDRKIKKTDFASILKLVESSLSSEDEWDEFKVLFDQLQPEFYNQLVKQHPDLTKSEIRLLLLIHIGYTQKEIASILQIAPDSVKKSRTRVRKKLKIAIDERLEDYLLRFSKM